MTVFLPENLPASTVKVVYLLHGLADNCTGWSRYTSVERYARKYNLAVVMPEVQRSFYADMTFGLAYFSFVHDELPQICSRMFGLSSEREKNYIMGLSMGGYGTLKCALNSPSRYAGCAAFSAVTDIVSVTDNSNAQRSKEAQAIFGIDKIAPESCDVSALLKKSEAKVLPRFYLACGEQDSLFGQNEAFAALLQQTGADYLFEHWPGIHSWDFWDVAVKKAFDYFFS